MKLDVFVTTLKCHKHDKEEYISKRIQNKYIPIKEKIKQAENIIENSMQRKNEKKYIDSVLRYIYTCTILVQMFTDLQYNQNSNVYDIFDILNENGILKVVIGMVDQNQVQEFKMILDMITDQKLSELNDSNSG